MSDLRQHLRQLGMISGRRIRRDATSAQLEVLSVHRYSLQHIHGVYPLGVWDSLDSEALAQVGSDSRLRWVTPENVIFLDTETTGLSIGVGTLVFLVGVGHFENDGFAIHQLFLRNPADEVDVLAALSRLLVDCEAIVTFNGRGFDVPLLVNRYLLNRQAATLAAIPNLDLLPAARRLWRRRLPSCALQALEQDILSFRRGVGDIPSHRIPQVYRDYLAGFDVSDLMARVFEHNRIDILSLVTLGVILCQAFTRLDAPGVAPLDLVSLARWHYSQGRLVESEHAYRTALESAEDVHSRREALTGLAYLLKRTGHHEEALPLWEALTETRLDTTGHEELAKHYEWRARDLARALDWTEAGLALARSWRPGTQQETALIAFERRQTRLRRKLGLTSDIAP